MDRIFIGPFRRSGGFCFGFVIGRGSGCGFGQQAFLVDRFLIRGPVDPTAIKDALPFVGQRTYGSLVVLVHSVASMMIVGSRPFTVLNGNGGEFVKGLAEEFRTSPTEMNGTGFTAAHGNGRDAAVVLKVLEAFPAIALRTEGGQEARRHHLCGSRERGEDRRVGVLSKYLVDSLLQSFDPLAQAGYDIEESLEHQHTRIDDGWIFESRSGLLDAVQSFLNPLLGTAPVLQEERSHHFWGFLLKFL